MSTSLNEVVNMSQIGWGTGVQPVRIRTTRDSARTKYLVAVSVRRRSSCVKKNP